MCTQVYIFLFTFYLFGVYQCYNFDSNSPLIKTIPFSNKTFFGFSLSVFFSKKNNENFILVGAPTDQVAHSLTNSSGALYTCPMTKELQDCVQRSLAGVTESSLFGYVVNGHNQDNAIYTCAPRFMKSWINVKYVEGACWELNEDFVEVEIIANDECLASIRKNSRDYEYRNCLTGGALHSLGKKQLLVTAPYSYEGRGLLINSIFQPEDNSRVSTYLNVETLMAKYQFTGLSMTVGKIYRENGVKTVVLGAPALQQSNFTNSKMGYGQVMLIKLQGNLITFKGFIYGDIFGSAFGYSVLIMDLNGDGFEELIVGAPYTGNNKGKVFIYWNQENEETNDEGYSFPLKVKEPLPLMSSKKDDNGQFGNCLENIGDINKDSFLDMAVSAPFEDEGRGSVYIFFGSNNGRILLSQKITASIISPIFRGFGFSLHGKGIDLDNNGYPDLLVGSTVSGHVVGIRSRPLIKIYAADMLPSSEHFIPYNLDALTKCTFEGESVACLDITISMFYYFPHLTNCPQNQASKLVNFTVYLDKPFLDNSLSKRVYFDGRSNIFKDVIMIDCKSPSDPEGSNSNTKILKIYFSSITFFNISLPIDILLKWSMADVTVPKRDYQAGGTLTDLLLYPMVDRKYLQVTNKILFGAGCTPESCHPFLTLGASLPLVQTGDEYNLDIGSSSHFELKVIIRNNATSPEDRAYNTFIKICYSSLGIVPTSISPGQYKFTPSGLTYAVTSPLQIGTFEESKFIFSLSNDFIEKAEKYIYLNVSIEGMTPQPHLKSVIMKIRIRMVANINLKVAVSQIDSTSYKKVPILGISAIKDEKKIGPRLKLKLSLSNKEQASVVVSSKLVIYFPWEVAGDPLEAHGQYLLYLQSTPKFFITGGKRNITCDEESLKTLINPIKTKMFESSTNNLIQDVSLAKVSLPTKVPKTFPLRKDLLLIPDTSESSLKSVWQNNVLLDCMNGTARCIPIVCDLGPLSRQSGEINMELEFRLWTHTFVENFISYKFVQTEIPVFWVPEVDYDIVLLNPDGSFQSAGIKSDNLQKPEAPPSLDILWAVLIAVCVGVILLITIILILYKCNFFRRQNIMSGRKRPKTAKPT